MLYMTSFNLKENRMGEYQQWIAKNEGLFQKLAPKGWTYKGTYAYVLGFGRYHAAQMWECSTYADFDTWREHDEKEWTDLFQHAMEFGENEAGESVLLREMGDTRIMEPEK